MAILDVVNVRVRLYKKCDTEVIATIKKTSHKFDNAITTKKK